MKIGLFADTFYPEINGVATSCLTLERELTRMGHEVHVYAPRCKGWEDYKRENIHYIHSAPFVVLRDRNVAIPDPFIHAEAEKMSFDVIHTNSEFVMGVFGRYVARKLGCARVHTYHTVWEDYTYYITHGIADEAARKLTRKYSRWWCDRFDRIITPTEKTLELLRRYGVKAPIDIIPSGMEIERFAPERHDAAEREAVRRECGIRPGERVLINIGRMAREKSLDRVMRVFPALHERFPDVRLVLVGEGPMREELARMAQQLGVEEHVTLTGPRPWETIDRYYAIGDVFVSASRSETQGLTYIEAMASGLCVCAVEDECLDGVIRDGESGILTADSDEALLEGLIRAFGPEGGRIAASAPSHAAPFSARHFAKRVENCYEMAVREKADGGNGCTD